MNASNVIEVNPNVKQLLLTKNQYTVVLVDEQRLPWVQRVEATDENDAVQEAARQMWQEQTGDPSLPGRPEEIDYVVAAIFRGNPEQVYQRFTEQ